MLLLLQFFGKLGHVVDQEYADALVQAAWLADPDGGRVLLRRLQKLGPLSATERDEKKERRNEGRKDKGGSKECEKITNLCKVAKGGFFFILFYFIFCLHGVHGKKGAGMCITWGGQA